jgi:hypothetical protein
VGGWREIQEWEKKLLSSWRLVIAARFCGSGERRDLQPSAGCGGEKADRFSFGAAARLSHD